MYRPHGQAPKRHALNERYRENKLEAGVGFNDVCILVSNKTVCLVQEVVGEQIQTMIGHGVVQVGGVHTSTSWVPQAPVTKVHLEESHSKYQSC